MAASSAPMPGSTRVPPATRGAAVPPNIGQNSTRRCDGGTLRLPPRSLSRVSTALALGAIASFLVLPTVADGDAGSTAALIAEIRRSFTIDGKQVPPEIFRDFGDGDLADS